MGKTCAVPRCRSGYKGVDMSGITMHTFREAWKNKIYRDGDWTLSKNHGICSKHFIERSRISAKPGPVLRLFCLYNHVFWSFNFTYKKF